MAKPQLIRDRDYGEGEDALKPAGNVYELEAGMLGADLPIYGKAVYLPRQSTFLVVGAQDKRANPTAVPVTDHPAGYFQMQVRRLDGDSDFDPSGVLIFHDNPTVD